MAYEPWYQSQGPSTDEVLKQIHNTEFHLCLHKSQSNHYRDNLILCNLVMNKMKITPKYLTYKSIRNIPNWEKETKKILLEEVEACKPFGSYRGFSTFVFTPLYTQYIVRVIREVWAANTIAKLASRWLEQYLSPDGKGFQNASRMWEERVKRIKT
mgnify:CR=1 FL=1